jgi:hypothetical protein
MNFKSKRIKRGMIGTLGRRQSTRLYPREYDSELGKLIESEVESFWRSIRDNTPPPPDYLVDGPLLEKLRGPIIDGDIINLSQDPDALLLASKYQALTEMYKGEKKKADVFDKERKAVKEELMQMIGRNETAIIGDLQISTREQVREDTVTYGSSFRRFDVKKRRK